MRDTNQKVKAVTTASNTNNIQETVMERIYYI